MYISRGYQDDECAGSSPPEPVMRTAAPMSIDYQLVHDRLTMLERLALLRTGGTLDEREFEAEKARILALPAEELVLRPVLRPARSPSLIGRLLTWKLVVPGIVLGTTLGLFARPDAGADLLARIVGALPA